MLHEGLGLEPRRHLDCSTQGLLVGLHILGVNLEALTGACCELPNGGLGPHCCRAPPDVLLVAASCVAINTAAGNFPSPPAISGCSMWLNQSTRPLKGAPSFVPVRGRVCTLMALFSSLHRHFFLLQWMLPYSAPPCDAFLFELCIGEGLLLFFL